jgi:hypothetical protein
LNAVAVVAADFTGVAGICVRLFKIHNVEPPVFRNMPAPK